MCCAKGKVVLPEPVQPPEYMWRLLTHENPTTRHFRHRIRIYNPAFNMASSTAKVERAFSDGVQAFRINGVVHQRAKP